MKKLYEEYKPVIQGITLSMIVAILIAIGIYFSLT